MTSLAGKRLPAVRSLYEILPKGAESGKEFARIVDLLLFHEARRSGRKVSLFSDVAGDYSGLDSFAGDAFRREGTFGYQYKFYPSPLSNEHRKNIAESLQRAAKDQNKLKLKKWILVTPQDFVESATRKDGGDVTWFENLRTELNLNFELEQWGHKQLLSLFLQTPYLCLYYYPELVAHGGERKKTIEDVRKRYDDNLIRRYRDIQFVGMSVYKQEATKGVPIERIYIPLSIIPDAADEQNPNVSRSNPTTLLRQGRQGVILGDPGSGKSTLLRFLALAGILKPLQRRYRAKSDERLTILITLRRYADELKTRHNLSLIDFIQENIQGDFTLKSADLDFFEYYLETGQTVLLFDGLDELPSPHFKEIIRDRIHSLLTTYPGNTAIVTSRIVGYDNPFRFDEKEFRHHRLTKLQLPEMEQFVEDWYRVRIENKGECDANVKDLVRILKDDSHKAIRELAENPLLLTIVALVHRIDAVLPDERVVLYQKCTETLLNTWHTSKHRESEMRSKGKVERRNRRRMETIANWMHCRSVSTGRDARAVVPYDDLLDFLTRYITEIEKSSDPDNDPVDLAGEFLEFVKKRAGLLIEAGDQQYSFVHLTFQEYLTASHIITVNEKEGAQGIWKAIKDKCTDPRWHEVIRLLVASLKSDESQEFLLEQIFAEEVNDQYSAKSRLLGGLLLDGIESAEEQKEQILGELIRSSSLAEDAELLRAILSMLRTSLVKEEIGEAAIALAFQSTWRSAQSREQEWSIALVATAMGLQVTTVSELIRDSTIAGDGYADLYEFFFSNQKKTINKENLKAGFARFWFIQDRLSVYSPMGNQLAAAYQSILSLLGAQPCARRAFEEQLTVSGAGVHSGPFIDFTYNGLYFFSDRRSKVYEWNSMRPHAPIRARGRAFDAIFEPQKEMTVRRTFLFWPSESEFMEYLMKVTNQAPMIANANPWQSFHSSEPVYSLTLEILCNAFALTPTVQWSEALRTSFLPNLPRRITLFDEKTWHRVEQAFEKDKIGQTAIYQAAWLLLFDSWLFIFGYHNSPATSLFKRLARLTRDRDAAPLRIAHCIRDLAYGNEARADELVAMIDSDDPEYRAIFEACHWRPQAETKPSRRRSRKRQP